MLEFKILNLYKKNLLFILFTFPSLFNVILMIHGVIKTDDQVS